MLPYPFSPTLDPSVNGVRIVVQNATGGIVIDATIPGGAYDIPTQHGWIANADHTSFIYRHVGEIVPKVQGIKRIVIIDRSARDPGRLKFGMLGRQGSYTLAPSDAPVTATLIFDAPTVPSQQCAQAVYVGSPPNPACTFSPDANFVVCR